MKIYVTAATICIQAKLDIIQDFALDEHTFSIALRDANSQLLRLFLPLLIISKVLQESFAALVYLAELSRLFRVKRKLSFVEAL